MTLPQTSGIRLLLLGGTGLVGNHILRLALASPAVAEVIAPTRKALAPRDAGLKKLSNPIIDFDDVDPNTLEWEVDAVICAFGTTIRKAGSRDAFRKVDYEYPLKFSRFARIRGASVFALVSATGANPNAYFFYNRVKGELEQALVQENFGSLIFARPGVIGGAREESRPVEMVLKLALTMLSPVLPRRWHLNPAPEIAARLFQSVLSPQSGITLIPASEMVRKRRTF
ncbi:MAG: NAD-dependent dehydratase [Enterobacter asburiae]|jgi:uncharacterized protein YbjT (DUF2867 family)|nr:NAD-dependent dehydratase [Enterobacter asburiae]